MKTKVRVRFDDGEVVNAIIRGEARINDRILFRGGEYAVVVEVIGVSE